jgi:hypothetical protein
MCGAGRLLARLLRIDGVTAPVSKVDVLPNQCRPASGWSFLLGLALVGITLQLPLAIWSRIPGGWFYGELLVCMLMSSLELALQWRDRRAAVQPDVAKSTRWPRFFPNTWIADLPIVFRVFVLMYGCIFLWFAAVKPCITFDARSIFGLKARMFDDGVSLANDDFHDPDRLNFNANYPLFVPVIEATLFRARSSQDPIGLQLLFVGFVLATASILAAEVRRFDSPQTAALWAAAFLLLPMTLSPSEGGGLSGSVDYAFAAFATAAVIATGRLMADPNGRTALLAGLCWGSLLLIKQEGQVWLLALGLALAGTIFFRHSVFSWKTLSMSAYAIAPALGCAALALMNRRGIPESPYFRSFGQALRWDWLAHVWKRPFFLVQFALRGITSAKSYGYCWQLAAVALVALRRPRLTATVLFWRLTIAAVIAGYFLVLTITPLHFEYQLRTALFRLEIHFLPLVLLIGAEQLASAGWTRQIQSIFYRESSVNENSARTHHRGLLELRPDVVVPTPHLLSDEQPGTVRAA